MSPERRQAILDLHPPEDRDEIARALDEYERLQSAALRRRPEGARAFAAEAEFRDEAQRMLDLRRRIYSFE